jgi:hypothetical protein
MLGDGWVSRNPTVALVATTVAVVVAIVVLAVAASVAFANLQTDFAILLSCDSKIELHLVLVGCFALPLVFSNFATSLGILRIFGIFLL